MHTLNTSDVADWLRRHLVAVSVQIDSLFLFGSVTRGKPNPRDCDVLVLTSTEPDSKHRRALRAGIQAARSDFQVDFSVPLSVILLGVKEFQSVRWFKRKGREKTLIRIDMSGQR